MTTEQATRAAIVAAVRAFVQRSFARAVYGGADCCEHCGTVYAITDELAALERAAAEGAPEGGSQETNAHE